MKRVEKGGGKLREEEKKGGEEGDGRTGESKHFLLRSRMSISEEELSYSFRRFIQPNQNGAAKVNPLSPQCHNVPKLMLP